MKHKESPPLHKLCADENLFQRWFKTKSDWARWMTAIKATFGEPLTDEEKEIYFQCTGRTTFPDKPFKEIWLIVGRRGGKSFILSLIAVYLACFKDYSKYLSPGEKATIMIVAQDRGQTRTILRYTLAMLKEIKMLAPMVVRETQNSVELNNSVVIEVATASFRSIRGYTIAAVLLDEVAFWRNEDSSNPDSEIINAIKPGMKTIPTALLLAASSPYARKGELWETYDRFFGEKGDKQNNVLVWKAPTWYMHPAISRESLQPDYDRDYHKAAAEYGGEFRTDVETFLSIEALDAVTMKGVAEVPYARGNHYVAFVDPSGGSHDSMTLAVAHKDRREMHLDCVCEAQPPFSPEEVVSTFSQILRSYRVSNVTGDRYAGEWPAERFRRNGIEYLPAKKAKSEIYLSLLPLITGKRCHILDNERMNNQFLALERRTARGGRDSVDHPKEGYDDLANAVAGALTLVSDEDRIEMW